MKHGKRSARTRRSAFTLVDATITLLILAGLVLIGGLTMRSLGNRPAPLDAAAAVETGVSRR